MPRGPPGGVGQLRREALAVSGLLLVLYAATAATTVQGGDASEFLVVGLAGGVAHPPGYPLFTGLVGLAGRVLPGPLPWRGACAAALCAAAAFGLLHHAARRLGASPLAALAATLTVALGTLPWHYATVSEVFAGGMLSAALVVLAVVDAVLRPGRPAAAWWIGAAFASGLAHHHTTALLAPLGLAGLAAAAQGGGLATWIGVATRFGAALAAGFLPYLAWLGRQDGAWRWGATETLPGLVHHLLRRDYGTFRLAAVDAADAASAAAGQVMLWLRELPDDLLWGVAALPVGLLVLARHRRGLAAGWAAALLLAGPAFAAASGLPAEGFWIVVVRRFHLLPLALCVPPCAVGLERLARRGRGPVLGAALALGAVQAGQAATRGAPHRGWTVLEDHLRHVLADAPPGALILGTGDSRLFGALYLQEVEGLRPDVTWVDPEMARMGWYRAWLERRDPRLRWPVETNVPWPAALARANLRDRPVLIADRHLRTPGVPRALPPAWPTATGLFRIAGPGERPPPPGELEARMVASLERATFRSRVRTRWQATRTWEYEAWDQPALAWLELARAWERMERPDDARRCVARALERSPLRPEVQQAARRLGLAPAPQAGR